MDSGLIFGIVLVLLILTFGTLTIIFSLKSWHWLHITGVCLVMVTLIPAMYYMAAYARTATTWGKLFFDTTKQLTNEQSNTQKLTFGDPPFSAKPTNVGRNEAVATLDRLMLLRGRVWRNCTATQFTPGADGAYVSKVTTLPQGTAPADASKFKNGIAPNTEVFIFRQVADQAGALTGYAYLGRFGVKAATESDIDVTPHEFIDQPLAAVFGPGNFLTVYEALPADDNSVFDDIPAEQREAAIRAVLAPFAPGGPMATGVTQEAFDSLVTSFVRHGGPKIDSDRPEEVWTKIKFIDDHSVQVDAEAVEGIDNLYDSSGRAIRGSLRRGGPVAFKKGDEIIVESTAADELIRLGKAEKVSDVYQRVERDFDTGLRVLGRQAIEINAEMQKIQRNIASMQETIKKLDSEIAYRTKEKEQLTSDLKGYENDSQVMTKVAGELNEAYNKLLDRLSEVYRQNQDMLAKIAAVDAKLAKEIDQRSQQAAAP